MCIVIGALIALFTTRMIKKDITGPIIKLKKSLNQKKDTNNLDANNPDENYLSERPADSHKNND